MFRKCEKIEVIIYGRTLVPAQLIEYIRFVTAEVFLKFSNYVSLLENHKMEMLCTNPICIPI